MVVNATGPAPTTLADLGVVDIAELPRTTATKGTRSDGLEPDGESKTTAPDAVTKPAGTLPPSMVRLRSTEDRPFGRTRNAFVEGAADAAPPASVFHSTDTS